MSVHTSNSTVCSPYMKFLGQMPPPSSPSPPPAPAHDIIISSAPQNLQVVFNCTAEGVTNVAVNMSIVGPYKPIEFVWTKRNNLGREGLIGGSVAFGDDVVYNGLVTPEFDPYYHSAFYLSSVEHASFYFSMLPSFAPQKINSVSVCLNFYFVFPPRWLIVAV